MPALTPHERIQIQQIAGWKAEPPLLMVRMLEAATHPIVLLAKQFVPTNAIYDAIEAAYPPALLFSFLPDSNPVSHGCTDGSRAASRDVVRLQTAIAQWYASQAAASSAPTSVLVVPTP